MMTLLSLLGCVLLGAFSAQAEVVSSFDNCPEFFYKGKEPGGMDQNAQKICQKLENRNIPMPHFATLYSTHHRIPLYSAYLFNPGRSNPQERKAWFIEPMLSGYSAVNMQPETEFDIDTIKSQQAINSDYEDTGYDRGHLNPRSYHDSFSRDATFTLTNAAPMDPCFNRVHWYQWEAATKNLLNELKLEASFKEAYLVTGTVPHPSYRIPQDSRRVTVPSLVWTAVCVEYHDSTKSFSYGYMGMNVPDSFVSLMSVMEMNVKLTNMDPGTRSVRIFADGCTSLDRLNEIEGKLKNQIRLPERLQIPTFQMLGTQPAQKRSISDTGVQPIIDSKRSHVFGNVFTFFQELEQMKYGAKTACLLNMLSIPAVSVPSYARIHDELRKRDTTQTSKDVKCQLVPEKSNADSMTTAQGTHCSNNKHYCHVLQSLYEELCTTPCLYQDNPKGYWCYSGGTQIQCSPQYSTITVNGEKCKDDHPCGTYYEDYYWCEKEAGSWDYCSPPLWNSRGVDGKYCRGDRACAKYDKRYNWCYTDNSNIEKRCCPHDDCLTASGKTCRPESPCDFYEEDYMWCLTTEGGRNWDYCCKKCQ